MSEREAPNGIVKTNRKVMLVGKNGQAEATLVDLSTHHAGVVSQRGAKVGTELELIFEIPALETFVTLSLHAIVTHKHIAKDSTYLKFAFTNNSQHDHAALEDFIAYKQRLIQMGKQTHVHEY